MRAVFRHAPVVSPTRFPIPILLPCEIVMDLVERLSPEAAVRLVCCCQYMRGLYCEDGIFPTDDLWASLLLRTWPTRLTGAPGPNAPPRLRLSARGQLSVFSAQWVGYVRELRSVRL